MTNLDPQTQAWINSLKLNKNFTSTADFQNGYNFGVILEKLQLSRGKKFKNSSDLACIFQNYKNVKDLLLQNFGYDFPVSNIIYRTSQLLKVLREQCIKYTQRKKIATFNAATSVISGAGKTSFIEPLQEKMLKSRQKQIMQNTYLNQTSKMPKKIQDIEKKLDKYREQKTRHQLFALDERKQQLQQYRRVVMNNRDYQVNKIRNLNALGKQKERKVYDVWAKTEQIKHTRIQTDKQFNAFQSSKRQKLAQTLRQQEVDFVDKGLEMFHVNCIRQGIQLQHDPDKPGKPEGDFNKVVVLERIKDNIKKHEKDKKQRIKRENKKNIEAEEAKLKSQEQWGQIHKLEDYQSKFMSHFQLCESIYKQEERAAAEKQIRVSKYQNKKYIDLDPIDPQLQQNRKEELRKKRLEYMRTDLQIMEKEWNDRISISEEVVEALLQVVIEGEEIYEKNQGFTYMEWKQIENRFLEYQTETKRGKNSDYFLDYSNFNSAFYEYLKGIESWKNYQEIVQYPQRLSNDQFTNAIDLLVSLSYPDKQAPQSDPVPLHMPLKIICGGERLSGKSTHTAKLAQKYGIPIIDPEQLIKQAIEMAKPPAEEDPKKGGKKDAKKQQPTPEKLQLKQFGVKLMQEQKIESFEDVKIQNLIEVIKFRLNQLFKPASEEERLKQYEIAKQKEEEKFNNALKDFEEAAKKPKKDSKKGGNEIPEEPPQKNPIFYTSGFIIDNFPISENNLKLLENKMTSYICWDERINKQGEEMRKKISIILPLPRKVQSPKLVQGTFDLFFSLEVSDQSLLANRNKGRKIDPQTKIIYHQEFNPIPDIKGFGDKLVQLPAIDESLLNNSQVETSIIKKFYSKFGFEAQVGLENVRAPACYTINEENSQGVLQTYRKIEEKINITLEQKYKWFEEKIRLQKIRSKQADSNDQEKETEKKELENAQSKQKQQLKAEEPQNQVTEQPEYQNKVIEEQNKQVPEEKKKSEQKIKSLSEIVKEMLPQQKCEILVHQFAQITENYKTSVKDCLYQLDNQRETFTKSLLQAQKNFTAIINRLDDRAGKILGFQENYNKLLGQQASIVRDPEASIHLITRLDELYDSLWVSIEAKKNEAVSERQKFMNSSWLNQLAQKVVEIGKKFLQTELNYLCESIFFILTLCCEILGKSSDYMTEYLSLGIPNTLEPIPSSSPDSLTDNKRLEYYFDLFQKCLLSLPSWIQQKKKKMKINNEIPFALQNILSQFVAFWLSQAVQKKKNIRNKINERILEERSYFHALVNKMNQWIIQGIKTENDFVYEIYKTMKNSIQQAKKCLVRDLHVKEITQVFGPIKQLTFKPIPLRVYTHHRKLPIFSYMIFLEEVRSLIITLDGRINFETFKKYMTYRKKSELLDKQILKIDFDTTSQYLVKDGYLYYRELALAVLFWDTNVFDDDALARYRAKLLGEEYLGASSHLNQENKIENEQNNQFQKPQGEEVEKQGQNERDQIEQNKEIGENNENKEKNEASLKSSNKKRMSVLDNPISKRLSLSDLILMEGAFDDEEQYIMKHFIFQIFRDKDEFIQAQLLLDTLCLFDQLQVLKYGDTVMMLGI